MKKFFIIVMVLMSSFIFAYDYEFLLNKAIYEQLESGEIITFKDRTYSLFKIDNEMAIEAYVNGNYYKGKIRAYEHLVKDNEGNFYPSIWIDYKELWTAEYDTLTFGGYEVYISPYSGKVAIIEAYGNGLHNTSL